MIYTVHSRYLEAQETLGEDSTTIMRAPGRDGGIPCTTRGAVVPRCSRAVGLAHQFVEEELLAPCFSAFAWEKYGKLPCPKKVFDRLDSAEAHWLASWAEQSEADPMFRDEMALADLIKRHVQEYLMGEVELDPMLRQLRADMALLNLRDIREHLARPASRWSMSPRTSAATTRMTCSCP
jgi:hypothetical protein